MLAPHRARHLAFAALFALALGCGSSSNGASDRKLHIPSPAWEDQVIYFVMTDRFSNGDPSNDDQGRGEFDPTHPGKYSGGDLRGIIDRLDYIEGLGATAIWITPPVANMWWDPLQSFGGYHGYWARHLEKVDEHLGTLDDYRALSDALHRRGMYLVQDVVPNHMGNFFQYSSWDPADVTTGFVPNASAVPTARPEQPPFDQNDVSDPAQRAAAIYHWTPMIADYTDPEQEKTFQISELDDLNSENLVVREALKRSYAFWIREVGVDAFRVDTAKFVPVDFWNDFFHSTDPKAPGILAAARETGRDDFLSFGEVFDVSNPFDDAGERKLAAARGTPATPGLPDVLQFPLYEEIGRVFASGKPTAQLRYRLEKFMDPALFPNPHRTPTFLDNHDVRRFLSIGSEAALAQALTFLFTTPGIPVVYQGTEQGFSETRASMFAGGFGADEDRFERDAELYARIKRLAALRKAHPALTRGTVEVLTASEAGAGAFAYRRAHEAGMVLVVMNTSDEAVLLSNVATGLAPGAAFEVLYAENPPAADPAVGANGLLQAVLPGRAVVVVRPTGEATAPPPPAATITVATPLEGETFAEDVTIAGTVSPADTRLRMVLDDYVNGAVTVPVAADGSWSVTLPVSEFPVGREGHALTFFAPAVNVTSPRFEFTTDVVFDGTVIEVEDPAGDDAGPAGAYVYPTDPTFTSQMDLRKVVARVGQTTLILEVTVDDWTTVWNPTLGFDHVAFDVYFDVPGVAGATFLPKLSATAPAGFDWALNQFTFGWTNAMYRSTNATPESYGTVTTPPKIEVDPATKTATFTYSRKAYGLDTWSGVKAYVTTWDFDGIDNVFRPLTPAGGPYQMGGGDENDPKIMDDVPPILFP